jgi:hypothetical protein
MTEQPPVRNRSAGTEDRIGRWAVGLTFFAAIVMLIAGTAQFFTGLTAVLGNVLRLHHGQPALRVQPDRLGLDPPGDRAGRRCGRRRPDDRPALGTGRRHRLPAVQRHQQLPVHPQNPFWTLTVIALDVLVIWALTAHPRDTTL